MKHYKEGTPDTLIVGSDYTRDDVGSPLTMSLDGGSTETTYSYDDINRLYTVTYPGQSQVTFGYDWVGNRTGTGWGAVNDVDQLPSDPFGNSYQYDTVLGNLVTRTKSQTDTTFEYDDYNLLKKINWPGGSNTQFISDAGGNRVRLTTSQSVQYNFMYDVTAGIPAVLLEQTGETNKLYIRTPDGRLIARVTATSTPTLDFYYHFDALDSTLALTNSGGTVTDTYNYDAWGNVTHASGTTQQPYQFVGGLGYYTYYQDEKLAPESQDGGKYVMLQLGVRYYAPEIGRFTQMDRVPQAAVSRYSYSDDKPLLMVDPSGELCTCDIFSFKLKGKCDLYDIRTGKFLRTNSLSHYLHVDDCAARGLTPRILLSNITLTGTCTWNAPGGTVNCGVGGGGLASLIAKYAKIPVWPAPKPRASGVRAVCTFTVDAWIKTWLAY